MSMLHPPQQHPATQPERSYLYRFIAQVAKSTWHVSVTQQLITIFPVGIITVLVHVHNGLITTALSWAYLRAAIQILLITYVLIVVINIVRAPFILDREQQERIAALSREMASIGARQLPDARPAARTQQAKLPSSEPDIEYRGNRIVERPLDVRNNILGEGDVDDDEISEYQLKIRAILVRFYYKPDVGTYDWLNVKAHIFFYDAANNLLKEVFDGVWYRDEGTYKTFEKAEAHELVLALTGDLEDRLAAYECDYKTGAYGTQHFAPELEFIDGEEFQIKVEIIADRDNDIRLKKTFNFQYTRNPEPALEEVRTN